MNRRYVNHMKKIKLGVGLWCVSFASDRFVGGGYRAPRSLKEQIESVAKIPGAESFDLHTSDLEGVNTRDITKMAKDNGLKINALNPNIFGDRIFKYGAFTNTDPKIWRKAVDLGKESLDTARELGASVSSLWPGQDGFDYMFQNNYDYQWEKTVAALQEICDYAPSMKIGYEYKPKEPRMFSLVGSAGKALCLVKEADRKNLGVVMDYGHSLFAGENPAEALCFLDHAGKLFNVHFNDAYGKWDDDLIAGSVNIWQNLEFMWYLKSSSYDGYVTLDMFPYREDPVEACSLAIRMIRSIEKVSDKLDKKKIRQFQEKSDAAAVLEYLRKVIFGR